MNEIAERSERKLRETFGDEAVCHTDPVMEMTSEIQTIEDRFKEILKDFPQIVNYHDFRVVSATLEIFIIVIYGKFYLNDDEILYTNNIQRNKERIYSTMFLRIYYAYAYEL